ncbi:MAG: hypothetical protein ACI9BK_001567 [Acidimicrobiales bacterium]
MERARQVEDRATTLAGDDTASREGAAIADAVNFVAHGLMGIAAQDEIAVHRMQHMLISHRLGRGPESLGDDEPSKDAAPRVVRAFADPHVGAMRFEIEHATHVRRNALIGFAPGILLLRHACEAILLGMPITLAEYIDHARMP